MGIGSAFGIRLNRRGVVALLLVVLPLLIYANTIFARFGFRDDYSILREVNEEPGKVLRLCSSHARPLYGWMLESFFGQIDEIDDLWTGRAVGALLIGGISALLYLALLRLGWPSLWGALFAALFAALPAAQVDVSWAICWPHLVGGVCSITAFLVAERGGWLCRGLGGLLVGAGALMYQPNSLFYLIPVAAGLLTYRSRPLPWRVRWVFFHLLTVGAALGAAFLTAQALYALGLAKASHLVNLETEPLVKLYWFLTKPLPNALALFALNDIEGISPAYATLAASVALVIGAGGWVEFRQAGWREGVFWAASFAILCIAASTPILVAAQRWPTYRTLFPLTGVCLAFFIMGLGHLNRLLSRQASWLVPVALTVLVTVALPLASWNAYTLFALPQQQELALLEEAVERAKPSRQAVVFVVRPDTDDAPAPSFYSDEFGSLSTDSDWAPREMMKLLLRERFPYMGDVYSRYSISCGDRLPLMRTFDLVIDMHRLRDLRQRVETEGYLLF